jgi:S-formylglutathione hydrolase
MGITVNSFISLNIKIIQFCISYYLLEKHKRMRNLIIISILNLFCLVGNAQVKGSNVQINVPVPRFENSLLKENTQQIVFLYLPPSYYTDTLKRYPVVYYLTGFGGGAQYFSYYMDLQISTGKVKEMIIVSPNSSSKLGGSFYVNSPLTGNWDDYISIDLVNYIDSHYRTISTAEARAISGHSMGGFGALNLSMLHPDIFCIGYGISPGLFDEKGLSQSEILLMPARNSYFSFVESIKGLTRDEAHAKYLKALYSTLSNSQFSYAYGSAFASDTSLMAPYLNYPYSKNGTQFIIDSTNFKKYDNGFGNLKKKVETYKSNLTKLKGYVIDYGLSDDYPWIPNGCRLYDKLLTEAGINHQYFSYPGTHSSQLTFRIKDFMLPYCSSLLEFDTIHFNTECNLTGVSVPNQVGTTVIDTSTKTVHVVVNNSVDLTKIKPTLYISTGAVITPLSNVTTDFSGGNVTYTIKSEDGKKNDNWTVFISKETTSVRNSASENVLTVYPNPVINQLFLSGGDQTLLVKITDLNGRIVLKTLNTNGSAIDVTSLKSGMYFLSAFNINDYSSIKFYKK